MSPEMLKQTIEIKILEDIKMTTIKYEIDGKVIEIEVDSKTAATYAEIEQENKRALWREQWHERKNQTSLTSLEDSGVQVADKRADFEEQLMQADELQRGLAVLTDEQRELIDLVYYKGYSLTEVAEMRGVHKSATIKQKARALEQLKKYFKNI